MSKLSAPEMGSVAGGLTAIGASLTLTQVGILVGIVTALLTFVLNAIYMYRKDRREERETAARMREADAAIAKLGAFR